MDVGILFYSPKSAAIAINEIESDINQWWSSLEVQKARKDFCEIYAKTPTSLIKDFDSLFDKVLES